MPVINQDQIILSPPLRPLNCLTPDGTNPNGIKRPLVQENVLKHHAARWHRGLHKQLTSFSGHLKETGTAALMKPTAT